MNQRENKLKQNKTVSKNRFYVWNRCLLVLLLITNLLDVKVLALAGHKIDDNKNLNKSVSKGNARVKAEVDKGIERKAESDKSIKTMLPLQTPNDLVVVRHGSVIDGSRIEGSVRVLLAEGTSVENGATITGEILTPGSPNVVVGSNVQFNGVVTGTGNAQPNNYSININNNSAVGHVVTRTDAISISGVTSPPRPRATRDVTLSQGQSPGDFTTIRNLSLNAGYGSLSVPPGIYGNLSASNSTFVFGVAGQSTTYNLQGLSLNNSAKLEIQGAVTINVEGNVVVSAQAKMGEETNPIALAINVANGSTRVESSSSVYGVVKNPSGQVSLNSNATLKGLVICDRLIISGSKIQALVSDTAKPEVSILEPTTGQVINTVTTVVRGSFGDKSLVTSVSVNNVTATITDNNYTATIPISDGNNTITVIVTDVFGNIGRASVDVIGNIVSNQAPEVKAGDNQSITLPVNNVTLNGIVMDDGLPEGVDLTITWSKVSSPSGATVTFSNANALTTTATFSMAGSYVLKLEASDSLLTASDTVTITVNQPQQQNQAPVVSAGQDQTITLPSTANLVGVVTDDGLPTPPGQVSITWSKVSGSATVSFSSPNTATTSATFSQAGTYILRLSVTDTALTSTDDVTIIVNPAQANNQAPQVNAGQDQTITLPNAVTLQGQVTDDGNPNPPNQLTLTWARVEGPGAVTFTNANGAITQASFLVAGTYTLRLTASDSVLSSSDDVIVVVNAAANQAPIVSAGANQSIIIPRQAALQGTVSDDGLPANSTITVNWSKVSGNGTVIFTTPTQLDTFANFSDEGTYVLRLTANDGQLTSSSDVTITVEKQQILVIHATIAGIEPTNIKVAEKPTFILLFNRTGLEDLTYRVRDKNQQIINTFT
ncbi:MAG: hypothetical protein HY819_07140, partial [Acidobacteria bacterium]|nr:hypothetical protein [Acidobacteriota bacterium]